jgi:hypothetical protein
MALCTLQEVKDWLKVTGNDQDAVLTMVQAAIEQSVVNLCETDFATHEYTNEVLDGDGKDVVVPLHWPIISVEHLLLHCLPDGTGGSDVAPEDMSVRPEAIYLANSLITPPGRGRVRLDYHAGYAAVPADVKMAVLLGVEAFMARKGRKNIGIASRGKEGESESYTAAWDKKVGLPTEVVAMLGCYRAMEFPMGTASRGV